MKLLTLNKSNLINDGMNSRFRYTFGNTVFFQQGDTIALSTASIPYSYFNITSNYNNNSFQYRFNGSTFNVVFPNGFYDTDTGMNGYLQQTMITNGHYLIDADGNYVFFLQLQTNQSLYKIQLNCFPIPNVLPAGWANPNSITLSGFCPSFIFGSSNFGSLIGFSNGTYPVASNLTTTQSFLSDLIANPHPINSVLINCSLTNQNDVALVGNSAIYSFVADVDFGNNILLNPQFLQSVNITPGNYSYFEIMLVDGQTNQQLKLEDPNTLIQLLIKSFDEK